MKSLLILASLFSISFSVAANAETTPLTSKNLVQHMVTLIGPSADNLESLVNNKAPVAQVCTSVMMTTQAVWQARNQVSTFQLGDESEAILNEWLNEMRTLQDICDKNPALSAFAGKVPSSDNYGTRLYQSAK